MDTVSVHDESFSHFNNAESLIEEHTISSNDNDTRTMTEDTPSEVEFIVSDELPSEPDMEEVQTSDPGDLNGEGINPIDSDDASESECEVTDAGDEDSLTRNESDEGQIVSQLHPIQVHNITTNNQQYFEASDCGSQNGVSKASTEHLDWESAKSESPIDKCEVEDIESNTIEPVSKTSVVSLERKESDGTSFWSYAARNSVVSMLDSSQESKENANTDDTEIESPRKLLQKKRSSLSHKPDIVRVFEKKSIQQNGDVHEFQKVMCGLKHVEDPTYDIKRLTQTEQSDNKISANGSQIFSNAGVTSGKTEQKLENVSKSSDDMKVDLIQDAVENDLLVSKTKIKEDKLSGPNKKKDSNKTTIKTPSRVAPHEKDMDKDNKTVKLKKISSKSNSLVKTKSKTSVESVTSSLQKSESALSRSVKQTAKAGGSIVNRSDSLKGKSVSKDRVLNKTNTKSRTSDKDIPSSEKTVSPDIISSHKKSNRKESTESQSSKKSDTSEEPSLEGDNPADLPESNREGFLAPTRARQAHMGDTSDTRSRTPSPATNDKKLQSPKEGSHTSGLKALKVINKKPTAASQTARTSELAQKRPSVKRTFSLKSKPSSPKSDETGELKRSTSLKKARNQPKEIPSSEKVKSSQAKKTNQSLAKGGKVQEKNSKAQAKNTSEIQDDIDSPKEAPPKKVPPPVAPKPANPNKLKIGCQLTDSTQNVCDNSTMKTTAMVTLNSTQVKPVVKKMINKTSVAEIAKLAESVELVVNETLHQTQFVSQAKATLSPVPQRKVRDAISCVEDVEDDNEPVVESGIVSESVSASSVIQMFGGVGKFKKVPKEELILSSSTDPEPSANGDPVLEVKEEKKKDLKRADSKKVSSGKTSPKEKQTLKPGTSQASSTKQRTQEAAKNSKSIASTKTRKDKVSNLADTKSEDTTTRNHQKVLTKNNSSKSISKESTFVKAPVKSNHKESDSSTAQKGPKENRISSALSEKSINQPETTGAKDDSLDPKNDSKNNGSLVKTTMVVRLHPGQNRKLSTMEDQEGAQKEDMEEPNSSCGWLAEVQAEDDPSSVCGLEISFKSVPQDIDIKLISGQANSQAEKMEVKPPGKPKSASKNSITRKSIDMSPDLNKTRQ